MRKKLFIFTLLLCLTSRIFAQETINQPIVRTNLGTIIEDAALNPTGDVLAVSYRSGGILLDTASLQPIAQLPVVGYFYGMGWSPNGNQLAITQNNTVQIWNWNSATHSFSLAETLQGNGDVLAVTWAPMGHHLVTLERQNQVSMMNYLDLARIGIWDTTLWQLEGYSSEWFIVDMSKPMTHILDWKPDGTQLVGVDGVGTMDADGNITAVTGLAAYVIDMKTRERVNTIPLKGMYALSVAWQPNGNLIAVGSDVGVGFYDLSTQQWLSSTALGIDNQALDWSADGSKLIAANGIYDLSAQHILGFFDDAGAVEATVDIEWSPDNNQIVIVGQRGHVEIDDPHLLPVSG